MHILRVNISQTVIDGANMAIANTQEVAYGLSINIFALWTCPILKIKVKVVHISTVNISQTMTSQTLHSRSKDVACSLSDVVFAFYLGVL